MSKSVLLTSLPPLVEDRIRKLAEEEGFKVDSVATRDDCQEMLLNSEILVLIISADLVKTDHRLIEVMKFYSNSLQFVIYTGTHSDDSLAFLSRSDIIGILREPDFDDDLLRDYLAVAVRMNSLEKKIESLNFSLQENHSVASELNLKNKVLERERNFNESIISSISYGLLITDAEGAVMLVNEVGKTIFGIVATDFYGMPYGSVVSENIRDNFVMHATDVLSSGTTAQVEGFNVRDDLIVSYTVSVIRDNFSNVIGLMFLGRDVTDWEQMTQQLFQAEKLATMGTMLSGIAHELRNPVTIINARAQRILTGDPLSEKAKKAVESIEHQSQRMGEIINNLLDFSRRKVSGFTIANINEVIDSAVQFLTLEGRNKNVEIIKAYTPDCLTQCDKNQMEQVFLNLFTNACDAMPEGGKLFLATENSDNYIRVSVRDTGTGIPEELKKKIFDPFFTTKEAGKGTGLGLAIVYKMVQAHKGKLMVRSKPGAGTTFIILLPKTHG